MASTSGWIPDSMAAAAVRDWASGEGLRIDGRAEGTDLFYKGAGPSGAVRISALSGFLASEEVEALCVPRLVRAELGPPLGEPRAWAAERLGGDGLAFFGATEDSTAGVLHLSDFVAPEGGSGEEMATPPAGPDPTIASFLGRLGELGRLPWTDRRERLWELAAETATRLSGEADSPAWRFVRRAGGLTLFSGGGAAAAGAVVAALGLAAPLALPIAATLGAAGGLGVGLWRAARAARIRLWPATRASLATIEASELFREVSLSPERSRGWGAGVLLRSDYRGVRPSALRADNRIEARSADGGLVLVVDTLSFPAPGDQDPRALLAPELWALVEARLPEGSPPGPVGRLEPLGGPRRLACWLTGDELEAGALHDQVLSPLALQLQKGRTGPYR